MYDIVREIAVDNPDGTNRPLKIGYNQTEDPYAVATRYGTYWD
jgi:hypothetical protein